MEDNTLEQHEGGLPNLAVTAQESASLDIIRTETVLSRLPVHNLARKGSISISNS
jgi:hypothetical protein